MLFCLSLRKRNMKESESDFDAKKINHNFWALYSSIYAFVCI